MNVIHLRIGSSKKNQVILENVDVDADHLELFCDKYGNVFITDLDTVTGTFINGQALKGFRLLKVGDKVNLGKNYLFDWENFILNFKDTSVPEKNEERIKQEKKVVVDQNVTEKPVSNSINLQLVIIYSCIVALIILLVYAI